MYRLLLFILITSINTIACAETKPIIDTAIKKITLGSAQKSMIRLVYFNPEITSNSTLLVAEQFKRPSLRLISQKRITELPYQKSFLSFKGDAYTDVTFGETVITKKEIIFSAEYTPKTGEMIHLNCIIPIRKNGLGDMHCHDK